MKQGEVVFETEGVARPAGTVAEAMKIACVGDSITRGTFVWRRKTRSYPAQLQEMLGRGYRVRNFGVNGHAVQQSADRPYSNSEAYSLSGLLEPDVVFLMLGTNDSRGDNWKGAGPFANDYRKLVEHYIALASAPRVWLLTPPFLFRLGRAKKVRYGMDDAAVSEMRGVIEGIAHEFKCGFIDINQITSLHPEAFRFDGVHPSAAGATLIAQAVYAALSDGQVA
ncbi:MAG: sialate O-acetylesterase [Coriobacteriia bacterium]|nr:sialate O-acetylesterase [Coriobacteriia bacterium]